MDNNVVSQRSAADHGGAHRTVWTPDGLRWHAVEAGDPARMTIVLVAGFPESAYAWRRVIPLLSRDFHVLAIDLPGQGYSAAPLGGYDTTTTSRRIAALLDHLEVGEHFYIGHDVGAWVGYAYSHLRPEHLLGTALIDANIPGVTLPTSIELGPESWRSWHFLFNAIPDLPEALFAGRERLLIEWFFANKTANSKGVFSEADLDEYARVYSIPGVMRGMLGYYRAVVQDVSDHAEMAKDPTRVPILALGAEQGSAPDLPDKIHTLVRNIRGGVIASGHYVPEEQPALLAERITDFIAEVRPS